MLLVILFANKTSNVVVIFAKLIPTATAAKLGEVLRRLVGGVAMPLVVGIGHRIPGGQKHLQVNLHARFMRARLVREYL